MNLAIAVHIAAAVPALLVGIINLARPKGTTAHRLLGRIWVALMLVVGISSFWIQELRSGAGFSWIHGLAVWTLFAVTMAVIAIRRGNVRAHRGWMIGTFIGLIAAAAGALAPGRLIPGFLFG